MDIQNSPERLAELKEKFRTEISNSAAFQSDYLSFNKIASLRFSETYEMYQFARNLAYGKSDESYEAVAPMFRGSRSITQASEESVRELLNRIK